jgi:hypothetical protein
VGELVSCVSMLSVYREAAEILVLESFLCWTPTEFGDCNRAVQKRTWI